MMEGEGQVPDAHTAKPEVAHLVVGGGAARTEEGWADVNLSHVASMKYSWTCNFCRKTHSSDSHARIVEHLAGKRET